MSNARHNSSTLAPRLIANGVLVLFRDSLLHRPKNGPGTQAGKARVLHNLQAHDQNFDAIFSPKTGGKNHILKTIPYLGIVYSDCFYTGNMADNVKGNYGAKFLKAIDFACLKWYYDENRIFPI